MKKSVPFKIPKYKLNKFQKLWLSEVLGTWRSGERYDSRDILFRLSGKIPEKFHPAEMPARTISSNGEQIKLLGIVALEGNYKFLDICNRVILKVKDLVIGNPKIESVDLFYVAELTQIPYVDVALVYHVIYEYGGFYSGVTWAENGVHIRIINFRQNESFIYLYRGFKKIQSLIKESLEREIADTKWSEVTIQSDLNNSIRHGRKGQFINLLRIQQLKALMNPSFDFRKLIRLCEELNSNFEQGNVYATAMLGRTVLHHIPPIFGMSNFEEVLSNYAGPQENKSFKKNMRHLGESLKHIADQHLHTQIRQKEILPTETQVDFRPAFDNLLGEIIRISK